MFGITNSISKGDTKPHAHLLPMAALVLFGLIALAGVAAADNVYHATPPVTVLNGMLNDKVHVDCVDVWNSSANTTAGNEQKVWANFTLNEAPNTISTEFARLYVVVYGGNMSENYTGHVSVGLFNDTNYFAQLADYQDLNLPYNKDTGPVFASVSDPLVNLTRVNSDYLLIFDIKNLIQNMDTNKLNVNISTWNSTGKFDGRAKNVQIIQGCNDTNGGDLIYYWVNEGFDTISKYSSPVPYYDETHFNLDPDEEYSTIKLWVGIQNNASYNSGAYKWNNRAIYPETLCSGKYGGLIYSDNETLQLLSLSGDNVLEYSNGTNSWYKLHTTVLTAELDD